MKNQVFAEFDKELEGLQNTLHLLHNSDLRAEKYEKWTFRNSSQQDQDDQNSTFWTPNTTFLAKTEPYIIRKESILPISIKISPLRKVFEDKNVKKSILGIPTEFSDFETQRVLYKKTQ